MLPNRRWSRRWAEQLAQGRVRISTADNKVQVEIVDRGQEGLRDSPDAGGPRGQVDQDTLEIYARAAAAQTETDSLIEVIDPRFAETTVQQQNASASGSRCGGWQFTA